MLWQVRAVLEDRPGAMAALAAGCGERLVNILGLQIFPAPDGRVVDELVLHTPGGWTADEVEQLCVLAGVEQPTVSEGSPHALEDQPVRWLRAGEVVIERPELLEEQLCRLLDAHPEQPSRAGREPGLDTLELDDELGPPVRLVRAVPFTDTELARAAELRHFAAAVLPPDPGERAGSGEVMLRVGTTRDARALVAMHARCSAETVYRRYHAPLPHLGPRLARALLEPAGGVSVVLAVGDEIVGIGMLAPDQVGVELGIMVEDRWQRQGYGTRLLAALAAEAGSRGVDTMTCLAQPGNDAVLRTIRRTGLRARVSLVDGVTQYRIPVNRLAGRTAPLVALLHGRRDLRQVYAPADLIDQAVRDGA